MAERVVKVIKPTIAQINQEKKQRVAAYCRVSTDSKDQSNSFSAQLRYYYGKRQYVWRCINRIEHGEKTCDAVGAEEQKLHAAVCRCLNKMFTNKDETMRLLENSLKYVLSGSANDRDAYIIEKQIQQLQSESENLMEMMEKTDGDTERYLAEIENNFAKIKALRNELDILNKSAMDNDTNEEFDRIITMFRDTDTSFEKFDDIVIRRLVECIRVMKDRRIVVVLKGGLSAEDSF